MSENANYLTDMVNDSHRKIKYDSLQTPQNMLKNQKKRSLKGWNI